MKKKYLVVSLFTLSVVLSSCSLKFGHHYRILEGDFNGRLLILDEETKEIETIKENYAELVITKISKELFYSSNGLNVIKDEYEDKDCYFSIDFKVFNEELSDFYKYDFQSLEYTYRGIPVYVDANLNNLSPRQYEIINQSNTFSRERYYRVCYEINSNILNFDFELKEN